MTAGDVARAGSPQSVRDTGSWLNGRTLGSNVHAALRSAAGALGSQSGAAVSMSRILTLIQVASAPAHAVQTADHGWGRAAASYGAQMEDIERRADRAAQEVSHAQQDVASTRSELETVQRSPSTPDQYHHQTVLARALTNASDDLAGARHRLSALDEERRTLDSSVERQIEAHRAQYAAARNALPNPPSVSAGVAVTARMPDGTERSVTALDLAALKDLALIAEVWNSLSAMERQRLIEDMPLLIGNLEGIPLRDRHTANVLTAAEHRDELEHQRRMLQLVHQELGGGLFDRELERIDNEIRSIDAILGDRNHLAEYTHEVSESGQPFGEYLTYDGNGKEVYQNGAVLVSFNPFRDSFITYQGALDPATGNLPEWMEDVGILVPGTTSKLGTLSVDVDRGKDLFRSSGKESGFIVWHGSPMPDFDPLYDAAQRGFPEVAGPRLAAFANSLQLAPGTDIVPIGHSNGAAVLGRAELLGLHANRVVYVSPSGLGHGASGIHDFPNTRNAPHFVVQARNDVIGLTQGVSGLGLGHGPNPLLATGVTRLETGFLEDGKPDSGTLEQLSGIEAHSEVFRWGSTSHQNIANAVRDHPVTLYHPDDFVLVDDGRYGRYVPKGGSGAAKPEVRIDPSTLAEVP